MSVAMCKKTPPGVGYDNSNMGGVYAEDKLTTTSLSLGAAGRQGIENLVRSGRGGGVCIHAEAFSVVLCQHGIVREVCLCGLLFVCPFVCLYAQESAL